MAGKPIPLEKKFWPKVRKSEGCWVWTGATMRNGYGQIRLKQKGGPAAAHRVSYEIHNGPIPHGLYVLHKCDNRPCVRPDHLFLGTFQDNMDDMLKKGRNSPPPVFFGRMNSQNKLSESQVKEIRKLADGANRIQSKLARKYGVSRRLIHNIINRKAWKHV